MTAQVLVLRPEPGLSATCAAAHRLGLKVQGYALSQIVPVAWTSPDPDTIDALLIGSANAMLHGGAALEAFRGKPAYVVGAATAEAVRAGGFAVAAQGQGGLQKVLDAIAPPQRLLRIAGEEHIELNAPAGITITTVIAYRSKMRALDPVVQDLAGENPLVLLHSAATARHFAMECERLGLDRSLVTLAALGPRIVAAAGAGWRAVHTAARPDDAALLEMVQDLCE
jgi:uroporphyrinogen-III synthase